MPARSSSLPTQVLLNNPASKYWTGAPYPQDTTSPANFLEIGRNLVVSSACCNGPRSSSGFRQTSKRSFNSDETAVVTRIALRAPLTTDDDDEKRTIQDGANRARIWALGTCPPSGGRIPAPWRGAQPPRWRGVVVWRCTPPASGRPRAVLSSEVCGAAAACGDGERSVRMAVDLRARRAHDERTGARQERAGNRGDRGQPGSPARALPHKIANRTGRKGSWMMFSFPLSTGTSHTEK